MKIFKTIAVATAAAFIALMSPYTAEAAKKDDGKNKAQLKVENANLKLALDSLRVELAKYQIELKRTDTCNRIYYRSFRQSSACMVRPEDDFRRGSRH